MTAEHLCWCVLTLQYHPGRAPAFQHSVAHPLAWTFCHLGNPQCSSRVQSTNSPWMGEDFGSSRPEECPAPPQQPPFHWHLPRSPQGVALEVQLPSSRRQGVAPPSITVHYLVTECQKHSAATWTTQSDTFNLLSTSTCPWLVPQTCGSFLQQFHSFSLP